MQFEFHIIFYFVVKISIFNIFFRNSFNYEKNVRTIHICVCIYGVNHDDSINVLLLFCSCVVLNALRTFYIKCKQEEQSI